MKIQEKQLKQILKIVGQNIRKHRKQAGFAQQGLSELIRMPRSSLSNLELGLYNPRLEDLADIARALRIPLSYLFEGCQYEKRNSQFTELEKKYLLLEKEHKALVRELLQIIKRNA